MVHSLGSISSHGPSSPSSSSASLHHVPSPLSLTHIPRLIGKSYANAYILTLFDALQSSKTDFEDKEDVDEFDAAPAPTKDFTLPWTTISKKVTISPSPSLSNQKVSRSNHQAGWKSLGENDWIGRGGQENEQD